MPAGPVSPPPLQSKSTEATATTTTTKSTSSNQYPAVLKGSTNLRPTAASPPNPNLVPSGKVPPPVPPRGSISARGKSSSDSGRGDHNGSLTHGSKMHVVVTTRQPTPLLKPNDPPDRAKIPNPTVIHEELRTHRRNTEFIQYDAPKFTTVDVDEFVSVEKVENSYVIKTSPYPFRPERKQRTRNPEDNASTSNISRSLSGSSSRVDQYTPSINMPKFTYFINPANNPELMNWKMSRKDKKHSETYTERMRRIQEEQEVQAQSVPQDSIIKEEPEASSLGISEPNRRSDSLMTRLRNRYFRRIKLAPVESLGRRLARSTSWLRIPRISRSTTQEVTESSPKYRLSDVRSRTFLGHAYPEWTSRKFFRNFEGKNPNVRKSNFKHPETLKRSLSDEEYRDYLEEQSEKHKNRAIRRNSSFLHGY